MNQEIKILDGTRIVIGAVPRSGRVSLLLNWGDEIDVGSDSMTAVDALSVAVVLLAAVEEADPALAPKTMRELQDLLATIRPPRPA